MRQVVRLAALLHDIGHGPLSHSSEEVMPKVGELNVGAYKFRSLATNPNQQANHEDYTIKFLTDSSLTKVLRDNFSDIDPLHIASLIDKSLQRQDDFFVDQGVDFSVILGQIVSSEMDVDRLDYLERDAYFCGTNYGKIEMEWLMSNLTFHRREDQLHLALSRRALYTFDDFILARHHMHLMVYFHHKSIIFEEMLYRYLKSKDCTFRVPSNIEDYIKCTDYALYEHLGSVSNPWARRVSERRPFRMLFELHSNTPSDRPERMRQELEKSGVTVIHSSSQARLSKYHSGSPADKNLQIYVVDEYDYRAQPFPLEQGTEIFNKYEQIRRIDRLYVAPEDFEQSEKILIDIKI